MCLCNIDINYFQACKCSALAVHHKLKFNLFPLKITLIELSGPI
uniref:Uncharacterized protein n=1 Tax=Manihot esculenta TaxID=3983 RepID=A0A2C9UB99_MANES